MNSTKIVAYLVKIRSKGEQDGGRVGGCGVHLFPRMHQEHTFRHRSACRTPAESRTGVHDQWKIYRSMQNSAGQRNWGGGKQECQ